MNLFYNPTGVGNVAFLQIDQVEGPFEYESYGDVVAIKKKVRSSALTFSMRQIT